MNMWGMLRRTFRVVSVFTIEVSNGEAYLDFSLDADLTSATTTRSPVHDEVRNSAKLLECGTVGFGNSILQGGLVVKNPKAGHVC